MISPQRKREILGLLMMASSLLLTMAILTYSPSDEALARRFSWNSLFSPGINQASNALGLFGAVIARLLVPGFLGYCVLLLPISTFGWGYVWLRNRSTEFLRQVTVVLFLAALMLATFLGWFGVNFQADLIIWSGLWGQSLADWMSRIFGMWGSFVLLALAHLTTVLVLIDHDLQRSIDRIEQLFSSIKDRFSTFIVDRKQRRKLDKDTATRERARNQNRVTSEAPPEIDAASKDKVIPTADPRPDSIHGPGPDADSVQSPGPGPTPTDIPTFNTQTEYSGSGQIDSEDGMADHDYSIPEAGPQTTRNDGTPDLAFSVQEQVHEELSSGKISAGSAPPSTYSFNMPQIDLLDGGGESAHEIDYQELEENKKILLDKLGTYNIELTSINAIVGPTVTLYELTPAPGIKISRITALENDLAMAMAARGIRMIAPIPGKTAIGVEIPNRHRELVRIADVIGTKRFAESGMELPLIMGKSIEGEIVVEDLTKMPHVLIAGATGSGKSVGLNTFIAGLLFACRPESLKFVMIDPKKIELSPYANIASHYIAMPPEADSAIITDVDQALGTLKSCEKEMERRYNMLAKAQVRSLKDYNNSVKSGRLDEADGHVTMPYLVIIVDELADLMMTAGKDIEAPIARLAQMARAVGIHLILATQRPSVDVITGLIKANFPARIAYQVASKTDSRTILDQNGAEGLVGNGDLLYMLGSRVVRLQGPFVSIEEVDRLTQFIGKQHGDGPFMLPSLEVQLSVEPKGNLKAGVRDEFFKQAAQIIVRSQQGSVSLLQRKLSVGYARAARLIDQLEDASIVGPFEGSKARQVLIADDQQLDEHLAES